MTRKTVFIVEDDPDISELMETIVASKGFKVETFQTGKNVLEAVEKDMPSLIFMDLWIPGTNGSKLTKIIKSGRKTGKIPIIIVSAKNSLDKIAKQYKADGFLNKPFNVSDLTSLLKKYVKK